MNEQGSTTQPTISDDQDLAKALAGLSTDPVVAPLPEPADAPAEVTPVTSTIPAVVTPAAATTTTATGDLPDIKKDAINELRPLVDKLDLPADEKFDTYLLLIRSTDDKTLIAPAHAAAQAIPDETRRAQALLDIIKEIDYLSQQTQPNA